MSFLFLSTAYMDNDDMIVYDRIDDFKVFNTVRKRDLEESDFIFVDDDSGVDLSFCQDYVADILKGYTTDDLSVVRDNLDFDEYRDSTFFLMMS